MIASLLRGQTEVQARQGDKAASLKTGREALALLKSLASQDPDDLEVQTNIALVQWRLAGLEGGGVTWSDVVATFESLQKRGGLSAAGIDMLDRARALQALQAAAR
jgi:hypothetical protein